MITIPLKLLSGDSPQRPAAGWFLAGDDPHAWLEEVLAWGVPAAAVRLFVVPRSSIDRRPCGVLVTVEGENVPRTGPRAQAYACMVGRLYLPVEARLIPASTDDELVNALPDLEKSYVWHPQAGLVGFEHGEVQLVRDLLASPALRATAWDRAASGVALNARILSLEPAEPPTLESILAAGRDEIGSQADDLDDLPPLPDEQPRGPLKNLGDRAKRGIARLVKGMSNLAPTTAGRETWVDRAGQWAQRVLSQPLLDEREKELRRLMQMLMNRPDEGLRYAIPMGGEGHRGVGRPGSRLAERDVNFSLGRFRGGGAADPWDIPIELQQQLAARYRELANREMRLGRHRRAAYIFAELLGDLNSAASALVSGRHFREAAVLYRDRLQRPFDAARCLEQGGLWNEAAELYLKLEAFEPAGDLFMRLEQSEEAIDAYGRAVDAARRKGDHLKAALILETKLDDADAALVVLDDGWPHSGQAAACLDETFRLFGRHGRHAAARAKMVALCDSPKSLVERNWIVETLVTVATNYPDASLRPKAEDRARILAASGLQSGDRVVSRALLKRLHRLVPFDRLHGRDIDRFERSLDERRPASPPARVSRTARHGLRLVREIRLPAGVEWQAADSNGHCFYAAGFSGNQLVLVRGVWQEDPGRIDRVFWSGEHSVRRASILLAANAIEGQPVLIGQWECPALPERHFVRRDAAAAITAAVTPLLSERRRLAFAQSDRNVYCIDAGQENPLVVNLASPLVGRGLSSHSFGPDDLGYDVDEFTIPLPVHARMNGVYVGFCRKLVSITTSGKKLREMRGPLRSLAGSIPSTRFRLAIAFDRGVDVMWDDSEKSLASCADDIDEPVICMTSGGSLVVCGANQCEVYATSGGNLKLLATGETGPRPLAVLATHRAHQFAHCQSKGIIRVFEFTLGRN